MSRYATALCLLAAILSACGAVEPAGLIAASRLDPLNTPPSEIAVAVGVPDTLRLTDGDAEFRLAFRSGTATLVEESAALQLVPTHSADPVPTSPDETIYVARIAPADAGRIAAAQREIRNLRAAGTEGEGTLSVTVTGGCRAGEVPAAIPVSTWLRTEPAGPFVPLTRRKDISAVIGASGAAAFRPGARPCADPGQGAM